jgi:chorismate mutase/prephenate dehydratase
MDLKEIRATIDQIDQKLLTLFEERMRAVSEVANYKKENHLPIFHPEREKQVIQNMKQRASVPMQEYAELFFTNLMETSKCYQLSILNPAFEILFQDGCVLQSASVACKGNKGAYSHQAAAELFPNSEICLYDNFDEVFEAVLEGKAECGLVPIINTDDRVMIDFYHLLERNHLYVNLVDTVTLSPCIAAKSLIPVDMLSTVYSHQFILEQCSDFLSRHSQIFPKAYRDTALSAKYVFASDSNNTGVICSETCAQRYGLEILERNIQNDCALPIELMIFSKNLYTNEACEKISIGLKVSNQPGELDKILSKLSLYHLNIDKIESCPLPSNEGQIQLYLDFWGNPSQKHTNSLLRDFSYNYESFTVLGCTQLHKSL